MSHFLYLNQVFVISDKGPCAKSQLKPAESKPPSQFAYVFVFDDEADRKKEKDKDSEQRGPSRFVSFSFLQ